MLFTSTRMFFIFFHSHKFPKLLLEYVCFPRLFFSLYRLFNFDHCPLMLLLFVFLLWSSCIPHPYWHCCCWFFHGGLAHSEYKCSVSRLSAPRVSVLHQLVTISYSEVIRMSVTLSDFYSSIATNTAWYYHLNQKV